LQFVTAISEGQQWPKLPSAGMQMASAAGDTWCILNFHENYAGDKL